MSLKVFSFFHLNLAYSAISVESRREVIERCYWPLLRLARSRQLPFGIEASAWTLETIAEIDPALLAELRDLVTNGPCEFIGSGYAQVIGPLVPAEVNLANFRIGMQRYGDLVGIHPKIALVNEQTYSAGLVPLYIEAGYEALIMEWNNPSREHLDWDPEWRYLPQCAKGPQNSERIGLIWNESISFQKFQRYAHGALELNELLDYVQSHQATHSRAFPAYGNDVEIFDFRPGRYMTEASIQKEGEWNRIDAFYAALSNLPDTVVISPSQVLKLLDQPGANQCLELSSAAQPIPAKKQNKYNVVRWAVTGRDDMAINTTCQKIYASMNKSSRSTEHDWKELCYLWSSDFRTHITEKRWKDYQQRLGEFAKRWCEDAPEKLVSESRQKSILMGVRRVQKTIKVHRKGHFLEVQGKRINAQFNCLRGLALDAFVDKVFAQHSVCGTLHHGAFDDIGWGADFYTGHLVFERPGHAKITDLNPVEPEVFEVEDGLCIQADIATPLGTIEKRWVIDDTQGTLRLIQSFQWEEPVLGSLRLGHITLLQDHFDSDNLCFLTHNGGSELERLNLSGQEVNHGQPVSIAVSANHAIGMTEGVVQLGDDRIRLMLECDMSKAATIGLVAHQRVRGQCFTRLAFSARELDDTSKSSPIQDFCFDLVISLRDGQN